jgi:hypothetical protein
MGAHRCEQQKKKMAERAGFEPAVHLLGAYNRLAGDRFRPLSHLSAFLGFGHKALGFGIKTHYENSGTNTWCLMLKV